MRCARRTSKKWFAPQLEAMKTPKLDKKAESTSKTSQRGLERGLLESPTEEVAATG
jgi:hypothetical protein